MQNYFYYTIIIILIADFIIKQILAYLNNKNWSSTIPGKLKGIYDEEKYKKSMQYDKERYRLSLFAEGFSFIIMILVLILGGFGWLDSIIRGFISSELLITIIFFFFIYLITFIFSMPFEIYSTFVIEEKYGFNKTTKGLFIGDKIKGFLLSIILGGLILSLIVWIYNLLGTNFWIYAWAIVVGFMLFFVMFYSSLIVPLFNKQTPLEDGSLRTKIQDFAKKVGFELDNIFVMDGSKRSNKANAYFSGLGPKKRIVLFDTLIRDLSEEEIVAVLAHEIGHYQKKHTLQMIIFSIIQTGIMFYLLSFALQSSLVSQSLGADINSFHIGLIAFGILFTPLSFLLGIVGNILSRKNEYEADNYALVNYNGVDLANALRKLSINNLSNLTPHNLYEFVYYSHPPVLKRLEKLQNKDSAPIK